MLSITVFYIYIHFFSAAGLILLHISIVIMIITFINKIIRWKLQKRDRLNAEKSGNSKKQEWMLPEQSPCQHRLMRYHGKNHIKYFHRIKLSVSLLRFDGAPRPLFLQPHMYSIEKSPLSEYSGFNINSSQQTPNNRTASEIFISSRNWTISI